MARTFLPRFHFEDAALVREEVRKSDQSVELFLWGSFGSAPAKQSGRIPEVPRARRDRSDAGVDVVRRFYPLVVLVIVRGNAAGHGFHPKAEILGDDADFADREALDNALNHAALLAFLALASNPLLPFVPGTDDGVVGSGRFDSEAARRIVFAIRDDDASARGQRLLC